MSQATASGAVGVGEWMDGIPCNLCGSEEYAVVFPLRASASARPIPLTERFAASSDIQGGEQVVRCRRCGLVYMHPRLTPEAILTGYAGADNTTYVSQAEGRLSTFRRCVKLLEPYGSAAGGANRRLLDIGCAGGFFVKAAEEAGWEAHGVEPSRHLVEYAQQTLGLSRVRQGGLRDAGYPDRFFDAVSYWDVLEHLADPLGELREVHRIVRPGGVILVNYPNFGSRLARLAGRRWWFLLSVHLYYFTPDTMRRMLEAAGFEVVESRRHFQDLSLGYLFTRLESYAPALGRIGGRLARALRLAHWPVRYYASQVNVIARRRSEA